MSSEVAIKVIGVVGMVATKHKSFLLGSQLPVMIRNNIILAASNWQLVTTDRHENSW